MEGKRTKKSFVVHEIGGGHRVDVGGDCLDDHGQESGWGEEMNVG